MAVVFRFLSTNPSIRTYNTMQDFESKHLHCPAFPLISCFQLLKEGNHRSKDPFQPHLWHSFGLTQWKQNPSLSLFSCQQETSTPLWHHSEPPAPPPPKTMGNLSVIGQPQRCSRAEHWHAQTWLCHLLSYVCQLTREKHKHFRQCVNKKIVQEKLKTGTGTRYTGDSSSLRHSFSEKMIS